MPIVQSMFRLACFSFLLCSVECGNLFLEPGDEIKLKLVQTITTIPFYASELHYDWCLNAEGQQVQEFSNILSKKSKGKREKSEESDCFLIDVGMNDGFYTNMAAAYGCRVYGFELQTRCIDASREALSKNNATDKVIIFHQPVSSSNGDVLSISFPEKKLCDGGFTMEGKDKESRTHAHEPLIKNKTFATISLSSLIPHAVIVDILKVDVEGHELSVLKGAMTLFKNKQIKHAFVELGSAWLYGGASKVSEVYGEIMLYGYKMITYNCPPNRRGDPEVFTSENLDWLEKYTQLEPYSSKWRCPDLYITLV